MRYLIKSLYLFLLVIFCGCNPDCSCNERYYNDLLQGMFQNESFLEDIQSFEINNPLHVDSKIYLAEIFYSQGNYDLSWNYLQRAEEFVNSKGFCCKPKDICKMYALIAQIQLQKKEVSAAIESAKKSVKNEYFEDEKNRFLLGRTYYISGDYEKAVENYEIAYTNFPEEITVFDAKNYMFSLNETERYEESENLLNKICENGLWFNGLGKFASVLYSNQNNIEKAVICSYLDFEFNSQIDTTSLEEKIMENSNVYEQKYNDFFAYNFLKIKTKILSQRIEEKDFIQFLSLEPYFINFSSYYWLVWKAVEILAFDERLNYLPVLKKVIVLNPDGIYADLARKKVQELILLEKNISKDVFDRILF